MSDLLNQASLVMIPSGYKEDVVYSQIPTSGAGDLSFTRASNGTRINSAGLVEVCPWNLVEQSNTFNASPWNINATTLTSGQTDKDGGSTAWKVEFTGGSNDSYIFQQLPTGQKTGAIWVKGTAGQTALIGVRASVGSGLLFTFNGSWQQFTETSTDIYLVISDFAGATATTFFIQNAQANIGALLKPYFPTTDRLNVPRLTYQNGGGGCPSLLLEKQSTNLVTYSEDFTQWTTLNTTVTANNITSPDGTQNADVIAETTVNSEHQFASSSVSFLASTKYTATIFAKWDAACTRNIHIRLGNCPSVNCGASFDKNGNFVNYTGGGNGTLDSYSSVDMGNGWRRFVVTITTTTTASSGSGIFVYFMNGTSLGYAGSTSQKINFYGAQLEASSYPTSYIPTTSSSATRVADACFKTGISSLIGQSQGTMFVDSVLTHSATTNEYLIQVSESASNRFFIYREAGTNKLGCFARVGSTTIYTQLTSGAITGRVKAVFTYQSGSFAFYVNGTQIGVSTATFSTPPTMDRLDIDSNAGAENGYYNYNEAILFKTRLTNAELQAITTI